MIDGEIMSGCPQPSGLASDGNTPANLVRVLGTSPAPPTATWRAGLGINPFGAPVGIYFINQDVGSVLMMSGGHLVLQPYNAWDGSSTWTFAGKFSDRYTAFRPFADPNLNMNVLGGCAGTRIDLYGWGGGDSNEIWWFLPNVLHKAPPSNFRIVSRCDPFQYVFIDKQGTVACAVYEMDKSLGGQDTSIWRIEPAIDSQSWLMGGVSIVNTVTGQALRAGSNSPVTLISPSQLDSRAVWDFGIGDGTNPYVAIRPLADDDQNLNLQGSCFGYHVLTYRWSGGATNEIWRLEAV